jgi:hypothetical protein
MFGCQRIDGIKIGFGVAVQTGEVAPVRKVPDGDTSV